MKIKHNIDIIAVFLFAIIIFLSGCLTKKKVVDKVKDSIEIQKDLDKLFMDRNPCINDTVKTTETVIDSTKYLAAIKEFDNAVLRGQKYMDSLQDIIDNLPEPTKENCKEYELQLNSYKKENADLKAKIKSIPPLEKNTKTESTVTDGREVKYWKDKADSCHNQSRVKDATIQVQKAEIKQGKAEKTVYKVIIIGLAILAFVVGLYVRKLKRLKQELKN